jgi:hypothetical protein
MDFDIEAAEKCSWEDTSWRWKKRNENCQNMFYDVCIPSNCYLFYCARSSIKAAWQFPTPDKRKLCIPGNGTDYRKKRGDGRGNVKGGGKGIEGHVKGAFSWQRFKNILEYEVQYALLYKKQSS